MNDYKLTPAERETIILWNEEDDLVNIETFDFKLIKMLRRVAMSNPEEYRYLGTNQYGGVSYEFSRDLLKIVFMKPLREEQRLLMSKCAKEENRIKRAQNSRG